MRSVTLVGLSLILAGTMALVGCRGGGVKDAKKEEAARPVVTAAGVTVPDDIKLRTLWDLKIKQGTVSGAWISEGLAMVAARSPNLLYVLRKQDGMNLWVCEFDKPVEDRYPPAVSADAVMVVSDEQIVRIHKAYGQVVCRLNPEVPISAEPVLDTWVETVGQESGVIFAPSFGDGRLWAIKIRRIERQLVKEGGEVLKFPTYAASRGWSRGAPQGGGQILAPVTRVGGFLYVSTSGGYVMSVRDSTGMTTWRLRTQGNVEHGVAIAGPNLFVGSTDYKLYCLDRLSGDKKWELPTGGAVTSRPMGDGAGTLVVCTSDGQGMLGVDVKSGTRLWTNRDARQVLGIGEKAVYVLGHDGSLLALDKKTGQAVWRSTLSGFRTVFQSTDQFVQPDKPKPLQLLAVTRTNDLVCLVEPDFKPEPIRDAVKTPPPPPAKTPAAGPAPGGAPPAEKKD